MAKTQQQTISSSTIKRVVYDVKTLFHALQTGAAPSTIKELTQTVNYELSMLGILKEYPKLNLNDLENIQVVIDRLEEIHLQAANPDNSNTIDSNKLEELVKETVLDQRSKLKTSSSEKKAFEAFKTQLKAKEKEILTAEALRTDITKAVVEIQKTAAPDQQRQEGRHIKEREIEAIVNKTIHRPNENIDDFTFKITQELEKQGKLTHQEASDLQIKLIEQFKTDARFAVIQDNGQDSSTFIESVKTSSNEEPAIDSLIEEKLTESGIDTEKAHQIATRIQESALQSGFTNQSVTETSIEAEVAQIAESFQTSLSQADLDDITSITNAFVHQVESNTIVQQFIQPKMDAIASNPEKLSDLPLTSVWQAINSPQFGTPAFHENPITAPLLSSISQASVSPELQPIQTFFLEFTYSPTIYGYQPTYTYSTSSSPTSYGYGSEYDYSPPTYNFGGTPRIPSFIQNKFFNRFIANNPQAAQAINGFMGKIGLPNFLGSAAPAGTTALAGGTTAAAAGASTAAATTAAAGASTAAAGFTAPAWVPVVAVVGVVALLAFFWFKFGGHYDQITAVVPTEGVGGIGDTTILCEPGTPDCAIAFCDPAVSANGCSWPTATGCITQGPMTGNPNQTHRAMNAIDIARFGHHVTVTATHDGIVTTTVDTFGDKEKAPKSYGNYVKLQGTDENFVPVSPAYYTLYSHLWQVLVSPGQQVKKGTPIGLTDDNGTSFGEHLHYEYIGGGSISDILPVKVPNCSYGECQNIPGLCW